MEVETKGCRSCYLDFCCSSYNFIPFSTLTPHVNAAFLDGVDAGCSRTSNGYRCRLDTKNLIFNVLHDSTCPTPSFFFGSC